MMRCSVVIALAMLCQTCGLCVGERSQEPEGVTTTTPQEDVITTTQKGTTTSQKAVNTSPQSDGKQRARTTVVDPRLEDGRVPTRADQLVVCSCPEPTPDGCRRFLSDAYIDSKNIDFEDIRVPVADLSVAVHDVTCPKKNHRFMTYSEGKFYLRERGDVVLVDAGEMTGLRVNDYCADLRRDLTWNMKMCVAPPSVPKCCPSGQALKHGKCQNATTPAILAPPMSIGLRKKSVQFPVIENHYNPLNCTSIPLRSVPLTPKQSYLLSVPIGLIHIWHPADGHVKDHYTYPPNLCVDGYVNSNGSDTYSVNFCYSHPDQQRKKCEGHICVRKCCPDGEEMSQMLYRCVPSNFTDFKPVFTYPPNDYRVVYGRPTCQFQTVVNEPNIDSRGRYHFHDDILTAMEYCVDKFNDGREIVEDMAIVCIKEPTKLWSRIRKVLFPILQVISFLFLLLTVGCYCVVPELLSGGGWYQLFHVFSLMVAYATMFAQDMFSKDWETDTCFIMGIMLQFSFLSTFFWLNVLCLEVWRKIRSLNLKFRAASVIPIWVYVLYAFGTPVAIAIITVCMHFFAPEDVPGVWKPHLARSRCFFEDPARLFLYFYGPIGFLFALNIGFITHTSWTYRQIEKNSSMLKKASSPRTPNEQIHRRRDYISEALTDTLNTLQGFFLFIIFIANRSKRKHLKKKFPLVFKFWNQIRKVLRHCCCWCCPDAKETCLAPLGSLTSQVSRKLSSSSIVSNLSTLSTSLRFSKSSFSMDLGDDLNTKIPSVLEHNGGITTLSHSPIGVNTVSLHDNTDTQC
ncbi:uncharacterized protein LOC123506620 isoform X2 [Portunus trituberculatus]|uniref:uncharacterized protein LOC123506620 isoform X2 n=1 Tax=Portunus trituberculatus TaxID=210409 RepID=UPI001E1D1E8F|nr:uncharacterized protein LOC123506620 isoform X2 [Portunus trituberculatus]